MKQITQDNRQFPRLERQNRNKQVQTTHAHMQRGFWTCPAEPKDGPAPLSPKMICHFENDHTNGTSTTI